MSKTLFMRGLQCPKSLWLDRKQPEVRTEPPPDLPARGADTIYEASFSHEGVFIKADIFHRSGGAIPPFDGTRPYHSRSRSSTRCTGWIPPEAH